MLFVNLHTLTEQGTPKQHLILFQSLWGILHTQSVSSLYHNIRHGHQVAVFTALNSDYLQLPLGLFNNLMQVFTIGKAAFNDIQLCGENPRFGVLHLWCALR